MVNVNDLTLQTELGPNADLLVKPDEWLQNHRSDLAARVSAMLEELRAVETAQRLKRELQQSNRVAVMLTDRDRDDNIVDVCVKVMPIADALSLLRRERNAALRSAQIYTWAGDGHDVEAIATLRSVS